MDAPNRITVLGAGITGLTAGWALSKTKRWDVLVLENSDLIGGLATTFTQNGFSFDLGSHRLHDTCESEVGALIRELCGSDLIRRDRRGVIYLHRKRLPYPPTAFDVLFSFGASDALRFGRDWLKARLHRTRNKEAQSFEDFTIASVGESLYQRFYKPYASKLYGLPPKQIAKDPAISRVRKFTLSSAGRDLRRRFRHERATYLYPAKGIGQLAVELHQRFVAAGGTLVYVSQIDGLRIEEDRILAIDATLPDGKRARIETNLVISTLPLDVLYRLVALRPDAEMLPPVDLRWRCLRLLYLITRDKIPSQHETLYFPEPDVCFGRVSELRQYSPDLNQDPERTVLTIEIPCSCGDELWNMPDDRLARRCIEQLQQLQILRVPASGDPEFFSRKLKAVYPVYDLGWRQRFEQAYQRLNAVENLYMIGRTALFLHCNIDHCMSMALKLSRHLVDGGRGKKEWEDVRQRFFDYRVRE